MSPGPHWQCYPRCLPTWPGPSTGPTHPTPWHTAGWQVQRRAQQQLHRARHSPEGRWTAQLHHGQLLAGQPAALRCKAHPSPARKEQNRAASVCREGTLRQQLLGCVDQKLSLSSADPWQHKKQVSNFCDGCTSLPAQTSYVRQSAAHTPRPSTTAVPCCVPHKAQLQCCSGSAPHAPAGTQQQGQQQTQPSELYASSSACLSSPGTSSFMGCHMVCCTGDTMRASASPRRLKTLAAWG